MALSNCHRRVGSRSQRHQTDRRLRRDFLTPVADDAGETLLNVAFLHGRGAWINPPRPRPRLRKMNRNHPHHLVNTRNNRLPPYRLGWVRYRQDDRDSCVGVSCLLTAEPCPSPERFQWRGPQNMKTLVSQGRAYVRPLTKTGRRERSGIRRLS
jgi:hypothetical protein